MKYFVINLQGKVVETAGDSQLLPFLYSDDSFALDRFFVLKEILKQRRKTDRILIIMSADFQVLPGHLEEIFSFLVDLRAAGKELYLYAKNYNLKELYLASACQHRLMPPEGTFYHLGIMHEKSYLKNLLDMLEIKAEVFRRGKYKGAADIFRTDDIDAAQREAFTLLLHRTAEMMEKTICSQLGLEKNFAEDLKSSGHYDAEKCLSLGFITQIDYWYTLVNSWKESKYKKDKLSSKKLVCGKGVRVAVLCFEGNIVDGGNTNSPFMGKACGDDYYVGQIAKIAAKKKYKAVIFKVNSGGGSATASAEIANALTKLGQKKPLLVVQGGVAGSGGYYISFPGEKIFTHHATITGSIGVIYLLFYTGKFMEKHGITHSVLKDGAQADLMSSWRVRSEEDKAKVMSFVDHIYQTFVHNVARARKMELKAVDEIAQGRIWPGYDAVDIGICDQIGGMEDARKHLQSEHNFTRIKFDFWPKQKKNLLQKLLSSGSPSGYTSRFDLTSGIKSYSNKPLCFTEELFMADFYL